MIVDFKWQQPPIGRLLPLVMVVLHPDKTEDSVRERQPGRDRSENRNKRRETDAQEEQPHTPTGQITGHIHFHLTLSLSR